MAAVRLNSRQRRALAAILPHDGRPGIVAYLTSEGADLHGLTPQQVIRYAEELEGMGLLSAELDETGEEGTVTLSSAAASYFTDSRIEIAKTIVRYLFQLLVGASGGVVALLLQGLLPG